MEEVIKAKAERYTGILFHGNNRQQPWAVWRDGWIIRFFETREEAERFYSTWSRLWRR